MKKRLLTAIIAFAAYSVNAQWINQNVPLVYEGFVDGIKVVDANTVWGRTYSNATGTLTRTRDFVRTIDGGNTWTKGTIPTSPVSLQTSNIYPLDQMTCYAALYNPTAAGGKVYKTSDGGTTWAQVGANMFTTASSFADFVYFWNTQNGIAMGDPIPPAAPDHYEIYLTTDSGATWTAVPAANMPALTDPAEYGIVDLYDAVDGHIWFGTTYGDIYRSTDGGNTWTKSATGLPPYTPTGGTSRQDISKVAFTDTLNGLVMQYDGTTTTLMSTNDGGLTWASITPTGNVYPGDLTGVPGSDIFYSAGSSAAGFGTTYSLDNGLNWTDIDAASHTSIDFSDSVTGFSGEYILAAAATGGAWKFASPVACGSASITPGTATVNDTLICWGDSVIFTVTGALPPTDGTTHGFSVIVSSGDLGQSSDPLNVAGVTYFGGTGVNVSPPTTFSTTLPNDSSIFVPGVYYFTPVVYGNATGTGNVTSLTLDPTCTTTGSSYIVYLLDSGNVLCTTAISEITSPNYNMNAFFNSDKNIDVKINSSLNGKTNFDIYDITGRNVFSTNFNVTQGLNHEVINVGNLGAGAYIIKAQTGTVEATSKLVKIQ